MGQEPREPSGLRQKEREERKEGEGGKETKREGGRKDGRRIKERRTGKGKKEVCCYSTDLITVVKQLWT